MTKLQIPLRMLDPQPSGADRGVRDALSLEALRLATEESLSIDGLAQGVFDVFEDESGVEPTVWSYSEKFGAGTATAQGNYGSNYPWNINDGVPTTRWQHDGAWPNWVQIDLGAGNEEVIRRYDLRSYYGGSWQQQPITWDLKGSNDGSNWDILDSQANWTQTDWGDEDTASGADLSFLIPIEFDNDTAYRYYRMDFWENANSAPTVISVSEWKGYTKTYVSGSLNEIYDGTNDLYGPTVPAPEASAFIAYDEGTAFGDNVSDEGFAFDGVTSINWPGQYAQYGGTVGAGEFVGVGKQWSGKKILTRYKVYGTQNYGIDLWEADETGAICKLMGSNDTTDGVDGTWTQLHTAFWNDSNGIVLDFTVTDQTTYYSHHKVMMTQPDNISQLVFCEVEFYGYALEDPLDMTLISEAQDTGATPDTIRVQILEEDVDSITLNTDLKAWVSRDGGTTWSQATLSEQVVLTTGSRVLVGEADVSGQPSGTDACYKITTANAKEMKFHGVALTWS
ncbi:MAG: hypothetical protein ISR47_03650 [Rhodospirillales bacterium]|nr:hypothetical protein [Rhodospirillales bacterium]